MIDPELKKELEIIKEKIDEAKSAARVKGHFLIIIMLFIIISNM